MTSLRLGTSVLAVVALALSTPALSQTPPPAAPSPTKAGYIDANGLRYYYEIHGSGEPLLLLHGGLGSIDMFGPILPALSKERTVIGVDLHGHGRTAIGDRPIRLPDIANDMAVIVRALGYDSVDVVGYSFGGGVALRLAIQHPAIVRRVVVASAPFAQNGFYPEMLPMQAQVGGAMAESMRGTPMYQSYVRVAPRPEDFPKLLDRMGELMRIPYDWSADVKSITAPVMLVFGDADMVRLDHVVEFYKLLGGGQRDAGWAREHMSTNRLAILPDVTHYELFVSPAFAPTIMPFLNGQSAAPTWTDAVK